ncbi:MAG: cellulase family glycosylhydrolase [Lachnospiraceae bacterium]|nr:cellulase family glycosylhydrolase [Lachnospiraceae bacterium]
MKQMTGYLHGINLGGWLSQCNHTTERYETFIREADIEKIRNWGLDHIRVPVDYELVEAHDGSYIESGFAYIQKAVDWSKKYGLNMILDLHKTYGYSFDDGYQESGFFDNEAYQERFYKLWEQFAKRFGGNANMLCFELLNEVTDASYSDRWNRILTECIRRIRVFAPDIKILVGGYNYNGIMALKDLCPPYDENIVFNFHFYEPLIFTHQGAYWMPAMDPEFRMPFASTYAVYAKNDMEQNHEVFEEAELFPADQILGAEYFDHYLDEAVRVANERNVALYCGEYGVINLANAKDTLAWYKMACACFDKHGIGRAAWSYKEMDFGIADAHMDPVRDELLKIL